jgi:RING finger protein 121
MVGKKDTCPVCNEKVDLSILPHSPWDKQERTWAQLLDALRYLIVWNPVIIIIANYTFSSLGIDIEQKGD